MIHIAIVGATGLVGSTFLKILEEKKIKNASYTLLASKNSAGKIIHFMQKAYVVQELTLDTFVHYHFDYALFSAGSEISKIYAPLAKETGTIVIDNSSYFRMDSAVPLVVPEVNETDILEHKGIIANPNCSTIQAVLPLKALEKYQIKRIIYSTYQAVSGAGQKGINDLLQTRNTNNFSKFPYNITQNCIPQIDSFTSNNYTKEEIKMIEETRKILHRPNLLITSTCVRVPIKNCHGESINIEFEREFELDTITQDLMNFPGIKVIDDINENKYPVNELANEQDDVLVGRIRRDFSVPHGINIWVVADNVRKGAATNAVQILEKLIKKQE